MTILAILPLSSCVKSLGVLEVRRSGRLGDPESDENCGDRKLRNVIHIGQCVAPGHCLLQSSY